ncbi:Uncharacterised protein [Serratia proteamaculans]|uniref:hypothetical protein n=1 Tax=Serratia proteamaculans TaxID=28151 RepID=UPI0021772E6E|nr:hypothetical protein [Serratia proteamaculans]CAI1704957.1 Uncharacterised protein [Serratia proteamaculans]
MSNVQHASVVMQLDDGRIVQRPLTIEERVFILPLLQYEGSLKVLPCEGVAFSGREIKPTAEAKS